VKNIFKGSLALSAALLAISVSAHAQTNELIGLGSSAEFLELGEATSNTTSGLGSTPTTLPECVFSAAKGAVYAVDSNNAGAKEQGQVWIAYTPTAVVSGKTTTYSCATTTSATQIYAYLQVDSVVGDRCLFNGCTLNDAGLTTSLATAKLVWPTVNSTPTKLVADEEVENLPQGVISALSGATFTLAGTDIRPEDAVFATKRALTPCGTAMTQYTGGNGNPTQYLGLGYTSGQTVVGYTGSSFNIVNFDLQPYFVQAVGIDPIVFTTNSTSPSGSGFNTGYTSTSAIQNVSRAQLALLLDGTLDSTADLVTPGFTGSYSAEPVTTIIREPVSGTYNTVEYNVPNTVESETSQDVGLNQPSATQNCNGSVPAYNAANTPLPTVSGNGERIRAIGTGQELQFVYNQSTPQFANTLGYSFWTVGNFAAAPYTTAKYLTVDGIDPLFTTYSTGGYGVVPVATTVNSASKIKSITFTNVINGTYPVWSLVRLVTLDSNHSGIATKIALAAAKYSNPSGHPDFVPYYTTAGGQNLHIERAHFTPPGIYAEGSVPAPQNGDGGVYTEVGGDVGGLIIPIAVDTDYINDTGITNGYTGGSVPSSIARD